MNWTEAKQAASGGDIIGRENCDFYLFAKNDVWFFLTHISCGMVLSQILDIAHWAHAVGIFDANDLHIKNQEYVQMISLYQNAEDGSIYYDLLEAYEACKEYLPKIQELRCE